MHNLELVAVPVQAGHRNYSRPEDLEEPCLLPSEILFFLGPLEELLIESLERLPCLGAEDHHDIAEAALLSLLRVTARQVANMGLEDLVG